jgi:hypothetical protein
MVKESGVAEVQKLVHKREEIAEQVLCLWFH